MPVSELGRRIFPDADGALADLAASALVALGSAARRSPEDASLLPCRVHAFFRGLPGLWACLDPDCPEADAQSPGQAGPTGRLYAQPQVACACGARVFEFYTCRNCGSAYARAYTSDLDSPTYLWHEPGAPFDSASGPVTELAALDLLLEDPPPSASVEVAELDLVTGRLNPEEPGGAQPPRLHQPGQIRAGRPGKRRRRRERGRRQRGIQAVRHVRRDRQLWPVHGARPPDEGRPAVPGSDHPPARGPAARPPARHRVRAPARPEGAHILRLPPGRRAARAEPPDLCDAGPDPPPGPARLDRTRRPARSGRQPQPGATGPGRHGRR